MTIAGDTLGLQQTNLYHTRRREWPRLQVTDVRVGPRTRRVILDQTGPTFELHIHLRGGELVRLFDGDGDAELQWLATALRRALRMPGEPGASATGA